MSDYPEHDKLTDVEDKFDVIHEFLVWLCDDRGLEIARYSDEKPLVGKLEWANINPKTLVDEFLGIDRRRLNDEKKQMLIDARAALDGPQGGDAKCG